MPFNKMFNLTHITFDQKPLTDSFDLFEYSEKKYGPSSLCIDRF